MKNGNDLLKTRYLLKERFWK